MNGSFVLEVRLIWSDRTIRDDAPIVFRVDVAAGSPFVASSSGPSR